MLYTYKAKYLSNYDGDTIDFLVDLGFGISYKMRVRLLGVNTPEIRSKIEEERTKARLAKDVVKIELSNAEEIIIKTKKDKTGKYGRYLADILYKRDKMAEMPTSLAKLLLERELAVPYE